MLALLSIFIERARPKREVSQGRVTDERVRTFPEQKFVYARARA